MKDEGSRFGIKTINVYFGVFDTSIICAIGPVEKTLDYVRWKLDDPNIMPLDGGRGFYFFRDGYVPIIWIPRRPRTAREHATLAHEAFHAVSITLRRWAAIELTNDTEEVFCHSLGHVIATVLAELK